MAKNKEKGEKPVSSLAEKKKLWAAQERTKKETFLIQSKKLSADIEKDNVDKKKRGIKELQATAIAEDDKTKKDLQVLETQAALEDLEFKENENHYFDVEKNLEEFRAYLKEHNLELGKEEAVKDFEGRLEELLDFLTTKKYKDFKKKRDEFNDVLEILYVQIEGQAKAEKEKSEKQVEPKKQAEPLSAEDKKYADFYTGAKDSLEEFFVRAENLNLDNKEKNIQNLADRLVELENLLNDKNYKEFNSKYIKFYDNLKRSSQVKSAVKENSEEPKKEEKPKEKTLEESRPVVAKTEEQERKEEEERVHSYDKHEQKFVLLGMVIRAVDKNEGEKRKLVANHGRQMKALQDYLDFALAKIRKTEDSKVFWVNINNFNNGFKEALAHLDPDLRELYEQGKVPKGKSLVEKEKEPAKEAVPVIEEQIIEEKSATEPKPEPEPEPEKLVAKVKTSETESVAAGEIISAEEIPEIKQNLPHKAAVTAVAAKPAEKTLAESVAPEPVPKKGLWGRIKDVFSKRETKEVAKKVTYDTVTSVVGLKFIIDALRAIKGKGDIAEWWKGRRETGAAKDAITMAFQDLVESLEKSKGNKALTEHEKIENRIANFKAKVESAKISDEAKKALLDRLVDIAKNHQEGAKNATVEKNKEMQRVLDAYLQAKVTGVKIARDFFNFALTATGFSMLRGAVYAGASVAERAGKARKEYVKKDLGGKSSKTELGFVAKDVFVNAAIETARALTGQGDKKGASGTGRAVDFIKALGMVARGFGIYGVALSGTDSTEQSIDKLIAGIKENGVASTVSHNFIQNVERVGQNLERAGHMATHPTEIFEHKGSAVSKPTEQPGRAPAVEAHEVSMVEAEEVPAEFSVDQFAAERNLSPKFAGALESLVQQYPELNNPESMQHILDASQVGGGAHSHHEIIKSEIDTLDESGGERRQVIFEEVLKNGGPESAANYLQSQNFSSRHLGYLSKYIGNNSPDEYLKFAQQYDGKDDKMVYGLFRAMQGKESTTLANAGLEGNGVDSHARGKINYFGLENKKPVLSGSGEVQVVEESFVTLNKNTSPAAAQNEGLSIDDKLWANAANVIRSMKGDAGYEGSSANAPAENMSVEERAVLAEVEGDKARFARLGERHIDILDAERSGKPVGEYINNTVQPEAPGAEPAPTATESVAVRKTINTFKASEPGTVVEAKSTILSVESKPIVSAAEKPLPAAETKPETVGQFLQEHNINPKEFVAIYNGMVDATTDMLEDKFILRADAHEFLQSKLNALHNTGINEQSLGSSNPADKDSLNMMEKLLDAENKFKLNQSEGLKAFSETMFDKNDKGMSLLLAPDRDVDVYPILTNGSHGARIWDSESGKDIFMYDNDGVFSTNKAGKLVIKYQNGDKNSYTQQKIIEISRAE